MKKDNKENKTNDAEEEVQPGQPAAEEEPEVQETEEQQPAAEVQVISQSEVPVAEPEPVLVPVSSLNIWQTFSYGGAVYQVLAIRNILVENTENHTRGEMGPNTLVEKV